MRSRRDGQALAREYLDALKHQRRLSPAVDAQVAYAFGEGALEGLQLLFQVNNLTNEPYIAYSVSKSRLLDYQEYGTQYLVGANYRF